MYIHDQPWKNLHGEFVDGNGVELSTPENYDLNDPRYKEGIPEKAIPFPWKKYPVIHVNFKSIANEKGIVEVNKQLTRNLSQIAKCYGVYDDLNDYNISPTNACIYFSVLIHELICLRQSYEKKVIILIDDYESIIHDRVDQGEKDKEDIDGFLLNFFCKIKVADRDIHLLVITGINPIRLRELASPVDIWMDESIDNRYSDIIGFTEEEVKESFDIRLFKGIYNSYDSSKLQESPKIIDDETIKERVMSKLAEWYNGYKFSSKGPSVYNSSSIMNSFSNSEIKNFWTTVYTSRLAYNAIQKFPLIFQDFYKKETTDFIPGELLTAALGYNMTRFEKAVAVGFQCGYLTITKKYTTEEIKQGIKKLQIKELEKKISDSKHQIIQLNEEKQIIEDDPDETEAVMNIKKDKVKLINFDLKLASKMITKSEDTISKIKTETIDVIVEKNDMGFDFDSKYYSLKIPNNEVYKNIVSAVERAISRFKKDDIN
eukprot:GAHX01000637.1.p1 GENE.GAHX01000637.1~~GAHX01000637.1.p1  ORF type:complete len:487 (+),score=68.20 GAHX01000637.1:408-1868(+)